MFYNDEKCFDIYTISKGDTLYKIAKEYGVNPMLLASLNGLGESDYIYPNQELLVPKNNYIYYITLDGDTTSIVADKFKIDNNKLLEENTIYLLPGQLLVHKK